MIKLSGIEESAKKWGRIEAIGEMVDYLIELNRNSSDLKEMLLIQNIQNKLSSMM